MRTNKITQMRGINTVEKILYDNGLTQTQLAELLGPDITKQQISHVMTGTRPLSGKVLRKLQETFPEYFTLNKDVSANTVEIPYCTQTPLPLHNVISETPSRSFLLDKQLFDINTPISIKISFCRVVDISDDSLSPMLEKGDRIIIDTSHKEFVNNQLFAFVYEDICYIRTIVILPNKIKCISPRREDTFYIEPKSHYQVLGLILPRIRF